MADKDLNPGQQHYEDLFDEQGGIRSAEEQAANDWEHDYSNPNPINDHNSSYGSNDSPIQNSNGQSILNHGEQSAIQDNLKNRDISLSQQEDKASHQTAGFDSKTSKKQSSALRRQTGRIRSYIIASGLAITCTISLMIAGFTVLSGPAQFIQAAEMFKDFNMGIQLGQQASRGFQSIKDTLAHNDTSSLGDNVRNSRLGVLGNIQANKLADRLSSKGISFSSSNPFGGTSQIEIDLDKYGGNGADLVKDLDIGNKAHINGNKVIIDNNLSSGEARRVLATLDDPGASKIASYLQTRALTKKLGYTSWLHPFQKIARNAENAAGDKLDKVGSKLKDFIEKQFGPIDKKAGVDVKSHLKEDDESDDPDSSESQEDIDSTKNEIDEAVDQATDSAEDLISPNGGRGVIKSAQNFFASKGYDVISLVFMVVCLANSLYSNNGVFKFVSVVIPALSGMAQITGAASQSQSGEDIDMETLGYEREAVMYSDNIDVVDPETGKPTGEKTTSSFWSNPKVCATLGTTGCPAESEQNTPSVLRTVSDEVNIFGNPTIDGILNQLLNDANLGGQLVNGACYIFNIVDGLANLLAPVQMLIDTAINAIVEQTGAMDSLMSTLIKWISGNPLALSTAIPIVWGAIGMWGSFFAGDLQGLQTGGTVLNSEETAELNLENRRFLAWENNRKPILARLFDPNDYNSSLNQVARAVRIDVSSSDFGTQLANALKTLTSAPSILATASNQLLGGSAYAAAATSDYGTPLIAWDSTTFNKILSDSNYSMNVNADSVIANLKDPEKGNNMTEYARRCLGVTIDTDDYSVSPVENSNGEAINFVDRIHGGIATTCSDNESKPDYIALRAYVIDFFNMTSGACYYGDADDSEANMACKEMGIDSTGLSGGIASGSQDPAIYQQEYAQYMKDHGSVEGLTVCDNGCTTVPAWFVSQHTTLKYGQGNGWQVAQQLADANGIEVTNTLDNGCKLPAVFSTSSPAMGSVSACDLGAAPNGLCGHTGLVVKMDDDGTIYNLESGASMCGTDNLSWIQMRTRAEWEGNTDFVCLGDYLK